MAAVNVGRRDADTNKQDSESGAELQGPKGEADPQQKALPPHPIFESITV